MLDGTDNKKFYELNDAVCFLGDCLLYGDDNLFNKIKDEAGPKFI